MATATVQTYKDGQLTKEEARAISDQLAAVAAARKALQAFNRLEPGKITDQDIRTAVIALATILG